MVLSALAVMLSGMSSVSSLLRKYPPARPGRSERLGTGLTRLDDLVGGLEPGRLWVVTGPSAVGRSTFMVQLARYAAVEAQVSSRLVSPLEDADVVVAALIAQQARVPLHHLQRDSLTANER